MIGAFVLRALLRKTQAATTEAKDLDALQKSWADDVIMTFVGRAPVVGKPAVEAWYRSWFDSVTDISVHSTNFALVRPYAFGFTNTVLFETTIESMFPDGRTNVSTCGVAVDFKRGKITEKRFYVAELNGEQVFLGTASADGPVPD